MIPKKLKIFSIYLGLWVVVSTCTSGESMVGESASAVSGKEELIRVSIQQLIVDPATQNPVVSLADPDEERALFIWIGPSEARAIHAEIQGIKHFRPLTHDLLASIIDTVEGKIRRIVITNAKDNVFYATILMEQNNRFFEIDARPSDSIVLALKFEVPIFVSKELFEKMSLGVKEKVHKEDDYGLNLQELTPELAEYLSFTSKKGVLISGIRKGSRADQDGLEAGDIIIDIGGQQVETVMSAEKALVKIETPVKAKIFRKSRFLTVTLHIVYK